MTNFFYFGPLSFELFFHLFFLYVLGVFSVLIDSERICRSFSSMRYSKMLEESSFANRKADYFWLLLQSAIMLLVRPSYPQRDASALNSHSTKDTLSARKPSVSFLPPCVCPDLPLVPASPVHAYISLWSRDDIRPLPSPCPRWSCLDGKRDLEGRCSGSPWMRCRPCWMVHEGCLD